MPGLGGEGRFWSHQIAAWSGHFQIIVHDHRGTGKSTRSAITYSVEQMAEDVLGLMDGLKIETAHLVGHSTGGAIGQVIAQDHPERIGRLVLSASWAGRDSYLERLFILRRDLLRNAGFASYWRASALWQYPPVFIRDHQAALAAELAALLADPPDLAILESRIEAILRFDRRARLNEIRARTQVVVAADDVITPPYLSEELAARIPGATLTILPYGGHFAPRVDPAAFNSVVGRFLRAPA